MKAVNKINLRFVLLLFVVAGAFSCTRHWEETREEMIAEGGVPVKLNLKSTAQAPDLAYTLYVFAKSDTDPAYGFRYSLPIRPQGNTLKFLNSELAGQSYRFLFLATPDARKELKVTDTSLTAAPTEGINWEEIRILPLTDSLTIHNYYGVLDMTGEEIIATTTINATLTRMVGQMQFWFFKAGTGGINDPVGIDPAQYGSVFDRISEIVVTYSQITSAASFDSANLLQGVSVGTDTYTQTLNPVLNAGLKLPFPQSIPALESPASAAGSVLIQGACFLPSDLKMSVTITFRYYDTTPVCGITDPVVGHVHTSGCYSERTLTLQLPPAGSATGLNVLPDHYTLNKAGLPCNRVIDIEHPEGIYIVTEWNE